MTCLLFADWPTRAGEPHIRETALFHQLPHGLQAWRRLLPCPQVGGNSCWLYQSSSVIPSLWVHVEGQSLEFLRNWSHSGLQNPESKIQMHLVVVWRVVISHHFWLALKNLWKSSGSALYMHHVGGWPSGHASVHGMESWAWQYMSTGWSDGMVAVMVAFSLHTRVWREDFWCISPCLHSFFLFF